MKKQTTFLFLLFVTLSLFAQNKWKNDVVLLENTLLEKEYLFQKISKVAFQNRIKIIQKSSVTKNQLFWKITELLHDFNIYNLELENKSFKKFPFEIKQFNKNYYITKIHPDYSDYLGFELLTINGYPIHKFKNTNYINAISFLTNYNYSKSEMLQLQLLSETNTEVSINLPLSDLSLKDLVTITPKKTPFYQQKSNRWFWKYGINYGQQVYFKYNIGLSKEFLQKTMDSLQVSELTMAKEYNLPLQSIYDAPTFTDFTDNLIQKFDNKRYKKLYIDVRNNTIGNTDAFLPFIKKINKLKRINKKNKLYILIDENVSPSVIELILRLKKELHITIIGANVVGIACSSNQLKKLTLPNTQFTLHYPIKKFENVSIEPDIKAFTSFLHYKNGVDPVLQKAME